VATLDSSEVYIEGQGFTNGPKLKRPSSEHCVVKIKEPNGQDAYVVIGGDALTREVEKYSFIEDKWTPLESLSESIVGPFCGTIVENGKQKIVVTAGFTNTYNLVTYIYDVEADKWSNDGPQYPVATRSGISVPYKDTFLTFGGENVNSQKIYMYNVERKRWDEKGEVDNNHFYGLGFLVPDELILCQGETA